MTNIVQQELHQRNRWIYFMRYRWVVHILYWLWVFVIGTVWMVKEPITPRIIFHQFFLENLPIAVFYYVYCLYLIPYYFKQNKNLAFWTLLLGSYLFTTALDVWFNRTFVQPYSPDPIRESGFWMAYGYNLWGYLFNFLVFSMMLFFMEKSEENRMLLELEYEKEEIERVRLDLLKTNISPDFLMRSLAQLKRSAAAAEQNTPQAILTFSDLLRYRLYWRRHQQTLLADELQALQNFISFIELNSFDPNLQVLLSIQGEAGEKKLAPLSLVNILEIFCKVQTNLPVILEMDLQIGEAQLCVQMIYHLRATERLVADLKTYGENYHQLFGNSISFEFDNCDDNRCKISLSLPLE